MELKKEKNASAAAKRAATKARKARDQDDEGMMTVAVVDPGSTKAKARARRPSDSGKPSKKSKAAKAGTAKRNLYDDFDR